MAEIHSSLEDRHPRGVAKGVEVKYTLTGMSGVPLKQGDPEDTYIWQWFIVYNFVENSADKPETWEKKKDDAGKSTIRHWEYPFTFKWGKVGRHQVRCGARHNGQPVGWVKFEQHVEELESILEWQMQQSKKDRAPNPHAELTMQWKWLSILDELGKQQAGQLTEWQKQEHRKRIATLEKSAEQLKALLNKCSDSIWPFRATYLAKESMEQKNLRVFLTQPRGKSDRVMIVDWTNLDEPKLHGMYEGKIPPYKGRTTAAIVQEAVKNALETWEDDNHYWPGGIRYEFNEPIINGIQIKESGTIKTGDTSWTDTLEDVLKKIAAGAAVIGLVLTGVGSVYAGALIVTSMVAGGAASVLSIHHRHSRGEESFIDDAIDVLDIVGNIFGIGGRAGRTVLWKAGATVRKLPVGKRFVDAMFIGEVMSDGFNGVLLGTKFVADYNKIMDNKTMLPEQRAQALLNLFGQAATAGVMIGLNSKVSSAIEEARWKRLLDQAEEFDLSKNPTFKGKTADKPGDTPANKPAVKPAADKPTASKPADKPKDGRVEVTTVTKQSKQPAAGVDPGSSTSAKPFPPKDDTIWKTHLVTDNEIELVTKDGYKFSAHIDKGRVMIEAETKINGKHNPHLGTGRENYERMFQHFEANGHDIKAWGGLFIKDNLAEFKKARDQLQFDKVKALKAKKGTVTVDETKALIKEAQKEAVLETVTGKYFWKPWAEKKGYKIIVEEPTISGDLVFFEVKFVPK
jgi:hypothetical protein